MQLVALAQATSGAVQTHVPFEQFVPVPHAAWQAPQFLLSVFRFTHDEPQTLSPAVLHTGVAHVPPTQEAVAPGTVGHTLPHALQLLLSVFRFTHDDPHTVLPGALHAIAHVPLPLQVELAPDTFVVHA